MRATHLSQYPHMIVNWGGFDNEKLEILIKHTGGVTRLGEVRVDFSKEAPKKKKKKHH